MIVRLRGHLESVEKNAVVLRPVDQAGVWLEAHVTSVTAGELMGRIGQEITLETVTVLEQVGQGTTITPRLLGFLSRDEKRLFELLTTVKGLGARRAQRAMAAPTGVIATAIAGADVVALKGLPEIGKKLAETIVLELREKVEGLAAGPGAVPPAPGETTPATLDEEATRAVEALVRLGEQRSSAESRVRDVIGSTDPPGTADEILAAAFGA